MNEPKLVEKFVERTLAEGADAIPLMPPKFVTDDLFNAMFATLDPLRLVTMQLEKIDILKDPWPETQEAVEHTIVWIDYFLAGSQIPEAVPRDISTKNQLYAYLVHGRDIADGSTQGRYFTTAANGAFKLAMITDLNDSLKSLLERLLHLTTINATAMAVLERETRPKVNQIPIVKP